MGQILNKLIPKHTVNPNIKQMDLDGRGVMTSESLGLDPRIRNPRRTIDIDLDSPVIPQKPGILSRLWERLNSPEVLSTLTGPHMKMQLHNQMIDPNVALPQSITQRIANNNKIVKK